MSGPSDRRPPDQSGAATALELESLHTYRGPAHVLQGVSLRVGAGEAVCLVGRNGAGKTTTIDSMMGLLPVRSGRILLGNRDITRLPTHERARLGIGYAPEDAGIFPDLTVAENFQISQSLVAAGRQGSMAAGTGVDQRVFDLFPEVRQFLSRRGLNLSGGQKKMVAIARALTLSPSILLLDEPFEGLAPVVVSRFIEAVRRIKAMGDLPPDRRVEPGDGEPDRRPALRHRPRRDHLRGGPRGGAGERGGHAHAPRVTPGREEIAR